jgi:hypothetical protein
VYFLLKHARLPPVLFTLTQVVLLLIITFTFTFTFTGVQIQSNLGTTDGHKVQIR